MHFPKTVFLLIFAGLGAVPALAPPAQALELDDLLKCREIEDNDKRLACFDAAAGQIAGEKEQDFGLRGAPDPDEKSRAADSGTAESGDTLTRDAFIENFGLPEKEQRGTLQSALARNERDHRGRSVFHLENGQVWRAVNADLIWIPKGPVTAVVTKKPLGGYWIELNGGRKYRVKRIK